jgi:hypothetical protein
MKRGQPIDLIASKTGHLGWTFKAGEPGGTRTRDNLIKKYLALDGVAT